MSHRPPAPHASSEDRAAAATRFLEQQPWLSQSAAQSIYVDEMENTMTRRLGLWPERYVLLEGPTVRWASSLDINHRGSEDVLTELRNAANCLWT